VPCAIKTNRRVNSILASKLGFLAPQREREREMDKMKGKRGGNRPLDEKRPQKRTRPTSGPAPIRRSLRLNPNHEADKVRHDKPEKQMAIHPKNIKKQVDLFDFFDSFSVVHRMTVDENRRYSEQVKRSGASKITSLGLLLLSVCLQL